MNKRKYNFKIIIIAIFAIGMCILLSSCGAGVEIPTKLSSFIIAGLENGAVADYNIPVTISALDDKGVVYKDFFENVDIVATNSKVEVDTEQTSQFYNGVSEGEIIFNVESEDLPLTTSILIKSREISWISPQFQIDTGRLFTFEISIPQTVKLQSRSVLGSKLYTRMEVYIMALME